VTTQLQFINIIIIIIVVPGSHSGLRGEISATNCLNHCKKCIALSRKEREGVLESERIRTGKEPIRECLEVHYSNSTRQRD
jgi:hypothetical protein